MDSGRVPSYKAIAIALLKNDGAMRSLGFCPNTSEWYRILKDEKQSQMLLPLRSGTGNERDMTCSTT
jgi:predicted phosphoadenosine phosphosulfate sulfurtransferase